MGIFDLFKRRPGKENEGSGKVNLAKLMEEAQQEFTDKRDSTYGIKPNEYKAFTTKVLALNDGQKVAFIAAAINAVHKYLYDRKTWKSDEADIETAALYESFMSHLLKMKLVLGEEDMLKIGELYMLKRRHKHSDSILYWPIGPFVTQIERNLTGRIIPEGVRELLRKLREQVSGVNMHYQRKDGLKIIEKIDALLFTSDNGDEAVRPVFFPGGDVFGRYANDTIEALDEKGRSAFFKLMALCRGASGGKPSKKFLDAGKELFRELGPDKFKKTVNEWFEFIVRMKETAEQQSYEYNGREYTNTRYEFIDELNIDLIKGFVWLCSHFHDQATLFNLAALGERCYRKIPGKGPAAAAIGNACFYSLANSRGLDGVGHLSRLKLRIKQSSTQTLIEKYLQEAAEAQGVTVHEVEDMAVDDYDMVDGRREWVFDDYKAVLEITGIGKTELRWFKPDGNEQKSVLAFVKEKYAPKLKKIKDVAKLVEVSLTAQRDRLDRMFKAKRRVDGERFKTFYFSHGLMAFLTRGLIWDIETDGKRVTGLFHEGHWVDSRKETLAVGLGEDVHFSLWHPVQSAVDEITVWREFLLASKIVQPLKQAFREIYILTDAEVNTRVYSNRMAAHILKQHQFNVLAKTRGWKYSLMGAFDDGRSNTAASIQLPDYELEAEYWINEVNAENAMNETGMWLYVATAQVRFLRRGSGEVVELIEVPAIILSEVMRDVDLFVGVASVGNDPAWNDSGGLTAYRDYWQSYSFGDLMEVAKTRKMLLERLLPRLKIAAVAEIKDKFLVVKGKLRTYKIHVGSTNILMEPNDQYLCIVPERGQKSVTEHLFLPFEGDNGLSVILSKAFLLAEDNKITDPTITRQIEMRRS